MKDMEELIWKAVKKCKLESAFWKLTKVFPSTEGMVSVLYRRQEQEEQVYAGAFWWSHKITDISV